ncbi:MAG: FlgD immunoglobulin-like domain containing protein [bacterium]
MPRTTPIGLAVLAALIAHAPARADVTFEDTEFPALSWTHEIVYDDGNNLLFSIGHEATGGNPGAHLRVDFSTPEGDGVSDPLDVAVGHFLVGAVIDPATFTIDTIDFSLDVLVLEGGVSGGVVVNLMVRQSDTIYIGPSSVVPDLGNNSWMGVNQGGLRENAFRDIQDLSTPPDFSPSGGPLEFGFVTLNGTTTTEPITQDARIDNYFVAVHQVPGTGVVASSAPSARLLLFPNPFRDGTTLRWGRSEAAPVRIDVFDVAGRRVRTLVDGDASPRSNECTWDGTDDSGRPVPAAAYFVRVRSGRASQTRSVLRVR